MAEINTGSGGGRKKGQPARMNLRVDFTPMVDMNMLLITFFMFCTTLATPTVMDIVMPTKDRDPQGAQIPSSKTTTLLLGADHKVYYYMGLPDYDNPSTLQVTDLSASGLRNILLEKNSFMVLQMQALKTKRARKEITEEQFKLEIADLKKSKDGQTVVIKPTDGASYHDLVNTLDEMQICGISRYAIVDLEDQDHFLLNNYSSNGQIAQVMQK